MFKWWGAEAGCYLYGFGVLVFWNLAIAGYLWAIYRQVCPADGDHDAAGVGSEPAFKQYFFRKAWHDWWEAACQALDWDWRIIVFLISWGEGWVPLTWPLRLVLLPAACVGVVLAIPLYPLIFATHAAIVAVCLAWCWASAWLLRTGERMFVALRGASPTCPHEECHRSIAFPIHRCPECSSEHAELLPGSYGLLWRRCGCGCLLPTLPALGRKRLESVCPHPGCRRPLAVVATSTQTSLPGLAKVPSLVARGARLTAVLLIALASLAVLAGAATISLEAQALIARTGDALHRADVMASEATGLEDAGKLEQACARYSEAMAAVPHQGVHEYGSDGDSKRGVAGLVSPWSTQAAWMLGQVCCSPFVGLASASIKGKRNTTERMRLAAGSQERLATVETARQQREDGEEAERKRQAAAKEEEARQRAASREADFKRREADFKKRQAQPRPATRPRQAVAVPRQQARPTVQSGPRVVEVPAPPMPGATSGSRYQPTYGVRPNQRSRNRSTPATMTQEQALEQYRARQQAERQRPTPRSSHRVQRTEYTPASASSPSLRWTLPGSAPEVLKKNP